jgi:hypothetical protein
VTQNLVAQRPEQRAAARGALHRLRLEDQAISIPGDVAERRRRAVAVRPGPPPDLALVRGAPLELCVLVERRHERLAVHDVEPYRGCDEFLAIGRPQIRNLGVEERAGPHLMKERRHRLVERVEIRAAMLIQEATAMLAELCDRRVLHQLRDVQQHRIDLGPAGRPARHQPGSDMRVQPHHA